MFTISSPESRGLLVGRVRYGYVALLLLLCCGAVTESSLVSEPDPLVPVTTSAALQALDAPNWPLMLAITATVLSGLTILAALSAAVLVFSLVGSLGFLDGLAVVLGIAAIGAAVAGIQLFVFGVREWQRSKWAT